MWEDTCGICGNTLLWWRSRSGYRVCMVCSKDPLQALEVLARRAGAAEVTRVQAWRVTTAPAREAQRGIQEAQEALSWTALGARDPEIVAELDRLKAEMRDAEAAGDMVRLAHLQQRFAHVRRRERWTYERVGGHGLASMRHLVRAQIKTTEAKYFGATAPAQPELSPN